jgi:hypothetical protein
MRGMTGGEVAGNNNHRALDSGCLLPSVMMRRSPSSRIGWAESDIRQTWSSFISFSPPLIAFGYWYQRYNLGGQYSCVIRRRELDTKFLVTRLFPSEAISSRSPCCIIPCSFELFQRWHCQISAVYW